MPSMAQRVQRRAPFKGPPPERYTLALADLHPGVRIAHRAAGRLETPERIILDHELVWILRGRGELHRRSGGTCAFERNDLLLIRPFEPHHFRNRGAARCEHLAIHFDLAPDMPPDGRRLDRREPYAVLLGDGMALPEQLHLDAGHPIGRAMRAAVAAFGRHTRPAGLAHLDATCWVMRVLLGMLDEARPGESSPDPSLRPHAGVLEAVADRIRREADRPHAVSELASWAGLSVPHFSRLFRRWSGKSPAAYVRQARIDHAKRLLRDPARSIQQVAYETGFRNPYHFSRVFRAVDGLCPSDYQAALQAGGPPRGGIEGNAIETDMR